MLHFEQTGRHKRLSIAPLFNLSLLASSPAIHAGLFVLKWRVESEKSRPGVTPDGFLMRLPARHCSGSAASTLNPDATWLMRG
jgi:hypothetical protein